MRRTELDYRRPMQVRNVLRCPADFAMSDYPICPRCGISMERAYCAYCDRCGQKLSWDAFHRARILWPGGKNK